MSAHITTVSRKTRSVHGWAKQPKGDSIFLIAVATICKYPTGLTHLCVATTNSAICIYQTDRVERLRTRGEHNGSKAG